MNFLAHLFLSGDSTFVKSGNFLGEFIRGKDFTRFTPEIQKGILLHRWIDTYTDSEPHVSACTKLLHATQGKYSPVLIDIYFDYLLACTWKKYCTDSLEDFAQKTYEQLSSLEENFPMSVQKKLKHMISYNWLVNYKTSYGLSSAIRSVQNRALFENNLENAVTDLEGNRREIALNFEIFFPKIRKDASCYLANL